MEIVLPFLVLIAGLLIGIPVAFALGLAGLIGLVMNIGVDGTLAMASTVPYRHGASYLLTTVPMFILMAEFLARGRLTRDLYTAMHALLGHVRGGLAMATMAAGGGFGAVTGSSTASAAAFANIGIPRMRDYGYSDRLSGGSVAVAGTLAAILPPSVALIIYGVATETSIAALFAAGIIPGILTMIFNIVVIYVWAKARPSIAPGSGARASLKAIIQSFIPVWPVVVLVVAVLGGIYSGIVTATEAGAIGATVALLVSWALGGLRLRGVWDSLKRTAETTSMILLLVIGASLFGYFLTTTQVPSRIFEAIDGAGVPPLVVMAAIIALYIVLGAFMEQISILLLTLPITFPLVTSLGYDGIWFGILVIKLAEVGLVSPPVGLNVFVVVGAIRDMRLSDVFKGVVPFLTSDGLIVALLFIFPAITLYLPSVIVG